MRLSAANRRAGRGSRAEKRVHLWEREPSSVCQFHRARSVQGPLMRTAQIHQIVRPDERVARTRDSGDQSHFQPSSRMSHAARDDGCSGEGRVVALAECAQDADLPVRLHLIPALNVRCSLTPTRPVHVLPSLNDTEGTPSPKSLSGGFHQTICAWRTFNRTWRPRYAYRVSSPGQVPGNVAGWRSWRSSDLTEC